MLTGLPRNFLDWSNYKNCRLVKRKPAVLGISETFE